MTDHAFSPKERAAVYRAIAERRDMRHFAGGEVAPELLARLLQAAHQVDGIVKGLAWPGWPSDPWQALLRLALQLAQLAQLPPPSPRR